MQNLNFVGVLESDTSEYRVWNYFGVEQCHETIISNILNKIVEIIARIDKQTENHLLNMEEISRQSSTNLEKIRKLILVKKDKPYALWENFFMKTEERKKENLVRKIKRKMN